MPSRRNTFSSQAAASVSKSRLICSLRCTTVTFRRDSKIVERVEAEEIFFGSEDSNTDSLNLEKIGVETEVWPHRHQSPHGDDGAAYFCSGDCTGPHEIVHVAIQQGEIAAHNIAHPHKKRSADYRLLVNVVFTDPQVAAVDSPKKRLARNRFHIS